MNLEFEMGTLDGVRPVVDIIEGEENVLGVGYITPDVRKEVFQSNGKVVR